MGIDVFRLDQLVMWVLGFYSLGARGNGEVRVNSRKVWERILRGGKSLCVCVFRFYLFI